MKNTMCQPYEIVISILRARLIKDENIELNFDHINWDNVIKYAINERVVLLLYDYFKNIPDAPLEIRNLKALYRTNAIINIRYEQQVAIIDQAFTVAGIPFIILKGYILSAHLYHDMVIRPSVDIDLLVHKDDFSIAYRLLQERGFQWHSSWGCLHRRFYRQMGHHLSLYNTKSHIHLELHDKLLPHNRSATITLSGSWERLSSFKLNGQNYQFFCPEDLLLYLCLHSSMESFSSLLHIYDIASTIHMHTALDWKILIKRAKEEHCLKRLVIGCALAADVFALDIPEIQKLMPDYVRLTKSNIYKQIRNKTIGSSDTITYNVKNKINLDLALSDTLKDRISILIWKGMNYIAWVND